MMTLRALCAAGILLLLGAAGPEQPSVKGQSPVAIGEYLVTIGGCNDCHTDGWNRNPGKVPVAQRLTGSQRRLDRAMGHFLSDQPPLAGAADDGGWLGAIRRDDAVAAADALVQRALDERA